MQSTTNYLAYLANCSEITQSDKFEQVHASMNTKIGYAVAALRAIELVMFMSSNQQTGAAQVQAESLQS